MPADYLQQAVERKPKEFRPRLYWAQALLDSGDAAKRRGTIPRRARSRTRNPPPPSWAWPTRWSKAGQAAGCRAAFPRGRPARSELSRRVSWNSPSFTRRTIRTSEAIAIYQQFPENAAAQEHIGQLMLENKKSAEAIAPLEAAMQKDPTPANRLALATAYVFEKQSPKPCRFSTKASPANRPTIPCA